MAKSLVRNRHAITKMYQLKSQLQAVSLRMAVSGCFHTYSEIASRRTSSTGYLVLPLLLGKLPSNQRRGFAVNGMVQSAADVLLSLAPLTVTPVPCRHLSRHRPCRRPCEEPQG